VIPVLSRVDSLPVFIDGCKAASGVTICKYCFTIFCCANAAGINFARDGMVRKDWLALVAVHSDAWLMSVAFYYGAKLDANARQANSQMEALHNWVMGLFAARQLSSWNLVLATCRLKLFRSINSSPTLYEIITGRASRPVKINSHSKRKRADTVRCSTTHN